MLNGFSGGFFVFLLIGSHEGSSEVHSAVLDETHKTVSKEETNWSRNHAKKTKRLKVVVRSVALTPAPLLEITAETSVLYQTPCVGSQRVQRRGLMPPVLKGLLFSGPIS